MRHAEAEQQLRVEQARYAERTRIAREMHDVLAHRISLLSLHAGALEFRPDAPPEEIARAAAVIRASAHQALEDLRAVIGVLRDGADGEAPQPPQPTLAALPGLLEESRAAGMRLHADVRVADLAAVPDAVGRHALRIVQEALTNARKHAAVGRRSTCASRARPGDGLTIEVRNPAPVLAAGGPEIPGLGTGLVGLAERATLSGGRLEHGLDEARRLPAPRLAAVAAVSEQIRVLVVDDDALVRAGLSMLLAGAEDIEIVGEAADGSEVAQAVAEHRPDVVLMDIRMPGMDGLAATELLRAQDDAPEVIVLTTFEADDYVLRALRAGASGFLLKDTPPAEIVRAVRTVAAGEPMLSPAITRRLIGHVTDSEGDDRNAPRPRAARPPHRTRARGRRRDRARQVQRRDRPRALHERRDRQGARLARAREARAQQPRPDRPARPRRRRGVNA